MQIIKSNMSPDELAVVRAESKPIEPMTIHFEYGDIQEAIEFWLNNVVFRHLVTVESIKRHENHSFTIAVMPLNTKGNQS